MMFHVETPKPTVHEVLTDLCRDRGLGDPVEPKGMFFVSSMMSPVSFEPGAYAFLPVPVDDAPTLLDGQHSGKLLTMPRSQRYAVKGSAGRHLGYVTAPLRGWCRGPLLRAERAALRAARVLWPDARTVEMEF